MRRHPLTRVLLALSATLALAGCMAYMEPDEPAYPDDWIVEEPLVPEPDNAFDPEPAPGPGPAPGLGRWVCTYEPTMDDDMHDDVVCSNGVEDLRPYLLEWQPFVTEDEIWDAALEYEEYLNTTYPPG